MTFVSYAQNFEDVMLARALSGIKKGFYVDVGAQNPVEHSVTKAFYDNGWSGINIEPVSEWHRLLCEQRSRDLNLNVAVGRQAGTLKFYSIEGTGLSTADREIAEKHKLGGWKAIETDVPVRSLTEILEERGVRDIHFLKVDVEGFEKQVLEGMDFSRFRPWIVLVEATQPLSSEPTHHSWESLLVGFDYQFVYYDGLNRFYVAKEHAGLARYFALPPNVFDDFIRSSELQALHSKDVEERLRHTEQALVTTQSVLDGVQRAFEDARSGFERQSARRKADIDWLEREIRRKSKAIEFMERDIEAIQNALAATLNSISWKITAPLRSGKNVLRSAARFLSRAGVARPVVSLLLTPFPDVKRRFDVLGAPRPESERSAKQNVPLHVTESATKFIDVLSQAGKTGSNEGGSQ